jgi:hypothetical protein
MALILTSPSRRGDSISCHKNLSRLASALDTIWSNVALMRDEISPAENS